MNTRNSNYLLFLLAFLTFISCEKENALECPGQGDRAIDIIAGPNLGGTTMAYLTNPYGGLRDERYVSTYPIFMNWLDGCQETYTVNLLRKLGQTIAVGSGFSYAETYFLRSYFNVEHGKAIDLIQELHYEDYSSVQKAAFSLTITGIPFVQEVILLPSESFTYSSDVGAQTKTINFPESVVNEYSPWSYIGVRLPGSSELRAICINRLNDQSRTIHFSEFNEVLREEEVVLAGEEAKVFMAKVVLDIAEQKTVKLGEHVINEQKIKIWMPTVFEGILLAFSSSSLLSESWGMQEYYEDLPTEVSLGVNTIDAATIDGTTASVELNLPGYVRLTNSDYPLMVTSAFQRSLAGLLEAGKTHISIPKVAGEFTACYPEAAYLENVWEEGGFRVTHHHYPAAQSLDQYKRLAELSWLDRQRYQWCSVLFQ
ncbi:hypothetical protein [Lewinella sp. LCG006]|uniref:hypothetical protein n=1 Tax=Lewinella sp. LCG006 TaxID=3231911 RepID=UPI003460D7E9